MEDLSVPFDTAASAHDLQRRLYLQMGPGERLATVFRLNAAIRSLALAGIRARHPEYSEEQVCRAHARLVLGDDLVRAVWPDGALVEP